MSFQAAGVNHEINNIDLTKVAGLQQKRILAFVNHFLVTTVQFLNKFTKDCEEKLMQFERKLEKANASMVLLESKLSSIPEVNIPLQTKTENTESLKEAVAGNQNSESVEAANQSHNKSHERTGSSDAAVVSNEPSNQEKVDVSPEYMRFLKMVQVGVPLQAVKLKLQLEGLDPDVLDKIVNKSNLN